MHQHAFSFCVKYQKILIVKTVCKVVHHQGNQVAFGFDFSQKDIFILTEV